MKSIFTQAHVSQKAPSEGLKDPHEAETFFTLSSLCVLQVLCGGQILPKEQHDSVPDGL